ncbi:MAG: hypothetical protein MUO91_05045 [candidate division Zixibacteria bacterium]|nr:hypothetical protein [candidate division Zixibacteria bacterium]
MELAKLIIEVIGLLAWPFTILVIVLIFKREIVQLLRHIKEAKFPGGSITLELNKLGQAIERTPEIEKQSMTPQSIDSTQELLRSGNSTLAIANLRIEIDREILRLMRPSHNLQVVRSWSISRKISALVDKGLLSHDIAERVSEYSKIANKLIHGLELSADEVNRAISIGTNLLNYLHYRSNVENLVFDFEGHGLWHMWRKDDKVSKKYYFWSAIAATLPEFEHSYEVYKEAVEKYLSKEHRDSVGGKIQHDLYVVSLEEFIDILRFRRDEIIRVLRGNWWEDNEWQWPKSWGELGWNGPVFRGSANDAEDELLRINVAIKRYELLKQTEVKNILKP